MTVFLPAAAQGPRVGPLPQPEALPLAQAPATRGARATFVVNSTGDFVDANPGDTICDAGGSTCTLRAAVMEANALGGTHTITIPGSSSIQLSVGVPGDSTAASGDLDITADITITSVFPGRAYIQGWWTGGQDRLFDVHPGGKLKLETLFLFDGGASSTDVPFGGLIRATNADLSLTGVILSGGTSSTGGGALSASNTIFSIVNSAFISNTSLEGGAILLTDSIGFIINTLVTANSLLPESTNLTASVMIKESPAGLSNVTIEHSTISGNYAPQYSSGLVGSGFNASTIATVKNSIVAGNFAGIGTADCFVFGPALIDWTGTNLLDDHSNCTNGLTGTLLSGDPALGPITPDLAAAGISGDMPYRQPMPNSPAIGAASCIPLLNNDQIGTIRPQGTLCDLGAIEVPVGSTATIALFPDPVEPDSSMTITVTDPDLTAVANVNVNVNATTNLTAFPDSETLTLSETAPNSGVFTGSFSIKAPPATTSNGLLEAGLGHTISIAFDDALNSEGSAETIVEQTNVVTAVAANTLVNGDFEAGSLGWTIVATHGDKVKSKNPFDGAKAFLFPGGAGKITATLSQTVLNPAVVDGNSLFAQAMISSGTAASGKMLLSLKTSTGRQVKASVLYAKNGAYALHFIEVPLALDPGETLTKAILKFTDTSQSGKVYVDAVSLTVLQPNAPRTTSRSGVMPPPSLPDSFRGQN